MVLCISLRKYPSLLLASVTSQFCVLTGHYSSVFVVLMANLMAYHLATGPLVSLAAGFIVA